MSITTTFRMAASDKGQYAGVNSSGSGSDTTLLLNTNGQIQEQVYLQWADLTAPTDGPILPDAANMVIESATLKVTVTTAPGSDRTISINRITSSWVETFTHGSGPTSIDSGHDITLGAHPGEVSASILALFQGWHDGTFTNHGIILHHDNKSGPWNSAICSDDHSTESGRPVIVVVWRWDISLIRPELEVQVLADWNGDLDFSEEDEDITSDVKQISLQHFRELSTEYMKAAKLTLQLKNTDHKYSPPKGTISGLQPGRLLWVRLWYPFDSFAGSANTNLDDHVPVKDAGWVWEIPTSTKGFDLDGSGNAIPDMSDAGNAIALLDFKDADVTISCNMISDTSGTPAGHGGLVFRYADDNNYLYVNQTASNLFELGKVIGGTDTVVSSKAYTWTNGDAHFIVVKLHGTRIRTFIDNVELHNTTIDEAAVNTKTKHGLFSEEDSEKNKHQDFGGFRSLFFETLTKIKPKARKEGTDVIARIIAFDDFERLKRADIKFANTLQTSVQESDEMLAEILTAAQTNTARRWLPNDGASMMRDTDEGLKALEMKALEAVRTLQVEEDGLIYQDGMGFYRFEERWHRAGHSVACTLFPSIDGTGTKVVFRDLDWGAGDDHIENVVEVNYRQATKAGTDVVYTNQEAGASPSTLQFDIDEVVDIICELDDVCDGMVNPVENTDYEAFANADGSGNDLSGGITVEYVNTGRYAGKYKQVRITWGNTEAGYLTLLQLRGNKRTSQGPQVLIQEDGPSVTAYGERKFTHEAQFIHREADAYLMAINRERRRDNPLTELEVKLGLTDKSTAHHLIQRDISDRMTVDYDADGEMGISENFYLEGYSWDILKGGKDVRVTWQLRGVW